MQRKYVEARIVGASQGLDIWGHRESMRIHEAHRTVEGSTLPWYKYSKYF